MNNVKDISKMLPMTRYYYLRDTLKICSQCKAQSRLSSFFNKEDNIINNYCNKCTKKNYEKEVMKIVLGIIKEGMK